MSETPLSFDIHFATSETGETVFKVSNMAQEDAQLRINPNGNISKEDVENFTLSFFDYSETFDSNSRAHSTAKTIAAIWGFMPGNNPEEEKRSAWQAGLMVSQHFADLDFTF